MNAFYRPLFYNAAEIGPGTICDLLKLSLFCIASNLEHCMLEKLIVKKFERVLNKLLVLFHGSYIVLYKAPGLRGYGIQFLVVHLKALFLILKYLQRANCILMTLSTFCLQTCNVP